MAQPQTVGQYLLASVLPADVYDGSLLDKKQTQAVFTALAEQHPDKYVDILKAFTDESRDAATRYGGPASVGPDDFALPDSLKAYRDDLRKQIHDITQNPNLHGHQKNKRIIDLMVSHTDDIKKRVTDESMKQGQSTGLSVAQGFRANPLQLTRLLFGDLIVADHRGRPIPLAGLHSYGEGVTPEEYWAGSYGSRKGYYSVQNATARSGYMAKSLSYMAQRLKVTAKDCPACTAGVGIPLDGSDPDVVGFTLAKTVNGIPAGTSITKSQLPALAGHKIRVMSLSTCQMPEGVCQMCAGKRENGRYPPIGSFVGITSARTIGEPLTQSGLREKHVGGAFTGTKDKISGLPEIEQFLNVPERFKNAAVLAPDDGTVKGIIAAPQGGNYIMVGTKQVYADADTAVTAKKGDVVEAGDVLTDGTPNPAQIAAYKGIGAGRLYFINQFGKILKDNGVPTFHRHVDSIARAFFDRVRVTDPEGLQGHNVDDVVPYTEIASSYVPRDGSETKAPKQTQNMFLERPVLSYSIGTRMTPSVIKDMTDEGVKDVIVHAEPAQFEPEVTRMMDVTSTDPDWKMRLSGFNLKKSFLQAATHGSYSKIRGNTSYVPGLMDPSTL